MPLARKDVSARVAEKACTRLMRKIMLFADRGDMLIYDASVLHWGAANSIPKNDRAIFYFGVSKLGSAARLDVGPKLKGFETIPPILLQDITGTSQHY